MKTQFGIVICTIFIAFQTGCERQPDAPTIFPKKETLETIMGLDILKPGDEVFDPTNNIIWQRCSLGETWNGSVCEGDPSEVTLEVAKKMTPKGWRIPSIRELSSLIYCESNRYHKDFNLGDGLPPIKHGCIGNDSSPAIHPAFLTKRYDLSYGLGYWSASPDKDNDYYTLMISFRSGAFNGMPSDESDSRLYVRYIRNTH